MPASLVRQVDGFISNTAAKVDVKAAEASIHSEQKDEDRYRGMREYTGHEDFKLAC